MAASGTVVELRVHGVSGTPAEDILDRRFGLDVRREIGRDRQDRRVSEEAVSEVRHGDADRQLGARRVPHPRGMNGRRGVPRLRRASDSTASRVR